MFYSFLLQEDMVVDTNEDDRMDVDEAENNQAVRSEISRHTFQSSNLSSLQGAMSIVENNEDDPIEIDEAEVKRTVCFQISRCDL
jgi:hypothetical protein